MVSDSKLPIDQVGTKGVRERSARLEAGARLAVRSQHALGLLKPVSQAVLESRILGLAVDVLANRCPDHFGEGQRLNARHDFESLGLFR